MKPQGTRLAKEFDKLFLKATRGRAKQEAERQLKKDAGWLDPHEGVEDYEFDSGPWNALYISESEIDELERLYAIVDNPVVTPMTVSTYAESQRAFHSMVMRHLPHLIAAARENIHLYEQLEKYREQLEGY